MERRRESRLGIELPGSYRLEGLQARPVYYSKLSANGCQLVETDSPLVPGDAISLSLGAIETVTATVVWVRGSNAGVQFETPLDDFLLDFFALYLCNAA